MPLTARIRDIVTVSSNDASEEQDDQASLAETESLGSWASGEDNEVGSAVLGGSSSCVDTSCDACPHCRDTCASEECQDCTTKLAGMMLEEDEHDQSRAVLESCPAFSSSSVSKNANRERYYTRCQVKRHNTEESAWILVGDTIYDATPILRSHPGGADCILRKAGGVKDCTMDLQFHSKRGRESWKQYKVGKLVECGVAIPPGSAGPGDKPWWVFWE